MSKKWTNEQVEDVIPPSTGSSPGEQKKKLNRSDEPVAAEGAEDRVDARDKISDATRAQSEKNK